MRVFSFIEAEKANFPVKFMCERLGVTRQGFYAWRKRPPSRRRVTDAAYTAVIKKIHADSRHNYGAPRICAELADDYGIRCGQKRVARLMRQAGIAGCHRRRRGLDHPPRRLAVAGTGPGQPPVHRSGPQRVVGG